MRNREISRTPNTNRSSSRRTNVTAGSRVHASSGGGPLSSVGNRLGAMTT